jgi:hypothetical protein
VEACLRQGAAENFGRRYRLDRTPGATSSSAWHPANF